MGFWLSTECMSTASPGMSTIGGLTLPWTNSGMDARFGSLVSMLAPFLKSPLDWLVFHTTSMSVDSPGFRIAFSPFLNLANVHMHVDVPFQSSRSPSPTFLIVHECLPSASCGIEPNSWVSSP